MTNSSLVKKAVASALGVFVYVALFGAFMQNIQHFMPDKPGVLGIAFMLMLFIISACITGSLVLLRPVLLYVDGQKKDAVKLFAYTVLSLFVVAVVVLVVVVSR